MSDPTQPPSFNTIDAEPHEVRSDRTRRNANAHLAIAIVAASMAAFLWLNRSSLTTDTLFWASLGVGGLVGGGLIVWLNQFRGV